MNFNRYIICLSRYSYLLYTYAKLDSLFVREKAYTSNQFEKKGKLLSQYLIVAHYAHKCLYAFVFLHINKCL